MSHNYSPNKRSPRKAKASYKLRSFCDGASCDETSDDHDYHPQSGSSVFASRARQNAQRLPKKLPPRRRQSQVRKLPDSPPKTARQSARKTCAASRSSSSSRSASSSLSISRRRGRKKASSMKANTSPALNTAGSRLSRASSRRPRVSFNMSANTTFSNSSSSVSPQQWKTRHVGSVKQMSQEVVVISPKKDRLSPSSDDQKTVEKLTVAGELVLTTVMLLYKKESRLVIDSRLIVVPKGITEEEMKPHADRLLAGVKVYRNTFIDEEDEMELMEMSVMTSDRAIFIRRVSEISLVGEASSFSCRPTEKICPVTFGEEAGTLHLEDVYSVSRTEESISRREKLVICFGKEKPNMRRLQEEMKASPDIVPPDLSQPSFYMEELIDLVGTTLTLERNMLLDKEYWQHEADWKERIVKNYPIVPAFARILPEPPAFHPLLVDRAAPSTTREKKGERLSRLEMMPRRLAIKESQTQLLVKNIGEKPAAWCLKTTYDGLFEANPVFGILTPGVTTRVILKFIGNEQPSPDLMWKDIEAGTAFDWQLLLADDGRIQKKPLPVIYSNQ